MTKHGKAESLAALLMKDPPVDWDNLADFIIGFELLGCEGGCPDDRYDEFLVEAASPRQATMHFDTVGGNADLLKSFPQGGDNGCLIRCFLAAAWKANLTFVSANQCGSTS